ncbi:MAG: hypothetical protein NTNFB02_23470 [Nitrospira sp.]
MVMMSIPLDTPNGVISEEERVLLNLANCISSRSHDAPIVTENAMSDMTQR